MCEAYFQGDGRYRGNGEYVYMELSKWSSGCTVDSGVPLTLPQKYISGPFTAVTDSRGAISIL